MDHHHQAILCRCCGGDDWQRRWQAFIVCRGCGLMTIDQTYTADQLRSLYTRNYFHGNEYADYVEDKPVIEKTLRGHLALVKQYVPSKKPILEVGCAYGYFLDLLKEDYPESEGIDISEDAVFDARSRGLRARTGDLLTTSFDRQFAAACLWDTIEHVPNPDEVFGRLSEVLVRGGHMFLTTGDFGALLSRVQGRRWRQIHPPTHLFYFTRQALQRLCLRTGFEPVRFGTVTVHRRIGSALRTLHKFRSATLVGRCAGLAERVLPKALREWGVPLNLGDCLYLVARKR